MRFDEFVNEDRWGTNWGGSKVPNFMQTGNLSPTNSDEESALTKTRPRINAKDHLAQVAKQRELSKTIPPETKIPPEKTSSPSGQPASNNLGAERPGSQIKSNYSLANDPVGRANAGEPTMGTPVKPASSIATTKSPGSTGTAFPSGMPPASQSPGVVGLAQKGIQGARRAGAGADVNTYAGAGGSFIDQQYLNDLKKASVSDPTNKNYQDEIQNIQNRIAKNQGSNDALQRTLGSKFQNTTANNPVSSAPMNRPGQANATTDPRSGTYAGSGQSSTTSANQTATLPAAKPTASTGTSAPAQSTSAYKGSAGAQAIQQANANKISDVNKIRAGDTIKVGGQDYTIKQGDTLDTIAKNQQSTAPTMTATTTTPVSNNSEPDFHTQNLKRAQDLAARSEPTPVKPSDADTEKTPVKPSPDLAEDSKSLNRIKSLAGLK